MYHASKSSAAAKPKAVARRNEEKVQRFRRLLAISIMSALTLGAILLARADWVTVNPDGSVTRTESHAQVNQPAPPTQAARTVRYYDQYPPDGYSNDGTYNGVNTPVYTGSITQPNQQVGNTTFFAGTYYPVPSVVYSYPTPGYSYPVGPVFPGVVPSVITTLPGQATTSYYGYPAYGYPGCGMAPMTCYPQPVYVYPNYATSGVYYSGPAGGGGTIYSSSTTTNRGYGGTLGNSGVNVSIGNTRRTTNSTTTVTTYGPRY